jgi:hypothetical protein
MNWALFLFMVETSVKQYAGWELSSSEVEKMRGPVVLEFGTGWCGVCRRAQPLIAEGLATRADVAHIKDRGRTQAPSRTPIPSEDLADPRVPEGRQGANSGRSAAVYGIDQGRIR